MLTAFWWQEDEGIQEAENRDTILEVTHNSRDRETGKYGDKPVWRSEFERR